jgi:hypothetical protein
MYECMYVYMYVCIYVCVYVGKDERLYERIWIQTFWMKQLRLNKKIKRRYCLKGLYNNKTFSHLNPLYSKLVRFSLYITSTLV